MDLESTLVICGTCVIVLIGMVLAFLTLPGAWFMLAFAVTMDLAITKVTIFHPYTLITLACVALIGEVLEFVASAMGARRAGGSKLSGVFAVGGALIGSILGTFLIPVPVLGTIAGGAIGAGVLALFTEKAIHRKGWDDSVQVASGAAIGRLAATFVKLGIALIIGIALIVAAVVP